MKRTIRILSVIGALVVGLSTSAWADDHDEGVVASKIYNRERGELSPGTGAPTAERMVNAIRNASPTALYSMLEYGERVECYECIPLLESKLLGSDNAEVREIAAWWLRKRPFGYGRIAVRMREVVISDEDPVRRSRAAEALGEFLDVHGLATLSQAAMEDDSADVRVSAVRALGRLNVQGGNPIIAAAFEDSNRSVRLAALSQVLRVNFFRQLDMLLPRLSDDDSQVRMRAAQIAGEYGVSEAVAPLAGLLATDDEPAVRRVAAWALGRIGGSEARAALRDADESENDKGVLDAIDVALRM